MLGRPLGFEVVGRGWHGEDRRKKSGLKKGNRSGEIRCINFGGTCGAFGHLR